MQAGQQASAWEAPLRLAPLPLSPGSPTAGEAGSGSEAVIIPPRSGGRGDKRGFAPAEPSASRPHQVDHCGISSSAERAGLFIYLECGSSH